MLRYLQTADEVFRDVVQEALGWMIEDLRENLQDPEAYGELAPRAAQFLDPPEAVELLERLRTCSADPELYQLQNPHRLLLIDVLTRYCDLFNEEPFGGYGSAVHEKYGLRHLDRERLIAAFIGHVSDEGHTAVGSHDTELLRRKRVRMHDLTLRRVSQEGDASRVVPATVSPWYRVGSESYPVVTAMA